MNKLHVLVCIATLVLMAVAGCDDAARPLSGMNPDDGEASTLIRQNFPPERTPPPPDLVSVSFDGESLEFWPYTGENFSGQAQDPINLIFFGNADPRSIRAALMSLDGDRTGYDWPDDAPFNGVWQDAIGNIQTGYGTASDWTGGAIQLACGDYHVARFHLRLFRLGEWTVGNAHFEILIPNTSDHQVVSWELAEKFVMTDMVRSGLLGGMASTQAINPSPFGTIPAIVYSGLPVELRKAIGGPLEDVTYDVPIKTDGYATIFNLAGSLPWQPGTFEEYTVSVYDQVIPKPFCASSPGDLVHVAGPVTLHQINKLTPGGDFTSTFRAAGELYITPVNMVGEAIGETRRAVVREHHDAYLSDAAVRASSLQHQLIIPCADEGGGKLLVRLRVNTRGANGYQVLIQCGDEPIGQASEPFGPTLVDARID